MLEVSHGTMNWFSQDASCTGRLYENRSLTKVETPIHDSIRELVTWECKEHGVKL
jgi:hypothetical protein